MGDLTGIDPTNEVRNVIAARLVWEEALRAVEYQFTTLSGLRNRAAALLIAVSVIAGLNPSPLTAMAFMAVAIPSVAVLLPHGGWRFHRKPSALRAWIDDGCDLDAMYLELAAFLEEDFQTNERLLSRLQNVAVVAQAGLLLAGAALVADGGIP